MCLKNVIAFVFTSWTIYVDEQELLTAILDSTLISHQGKTVHGKHCEISIVKILTLPFHEENIIN